MTKLSINSLNLRPQVKRLFRRPKHVEIPDYVWVESFYALDNQRNFDIQKALDYMATNFKIHFDFKPLDSAYQCYIACSKETKSSEDKLLDFLEDDDAEIARKIYEAASEVL